MYCREINIGTEKALVVTKREGFLQRCNHLVCSKLVPGY